MSIQYYPDPFLSPYSYGGGYDFGYGGGNYNWDSRTGYYPSGFDPLGTGLLTRPYSAPTTHTVVQPVVVKPPQQVGQSYVNTQSSQPTTVSKVPTVQSPEDYLEDHQQIAGNKVIGKDAPTRLWDRISAGVQDWVDPTQDRDKRGGVWVKDPLVPKSKGMYVKVDPETGYGGTVEDMIANAPKKPQPAPPEADKQPNRTLPDNPRTTATGQLKHLGMNTLLSRVDDFLTGQRMQGADDRAFNNLVRTRQWLDPNNINFMTAQQMTPFGQAKLAESRVAQIAGMTGAATDAANRKALLRNSLANMGMASVAKATAGLQGSGRAIA